MHYLTTLGGQLKAVAVVAIATCLTANQVGPERPELAERRAMDALRAISDAEEDFRRSDRDGNGVKDYWTADVRGLYWEGRRLDRDIAFADGNGLGAELRRPRPCHGYFFCAVQFDGRATPAEPYRQDTDGTKRPRHHASRYAFCAYPASSGRTGTRTFLIDETRQVVSLDTGGRPVFTWPR